MKSSRSRFRYLLLLLTLPFLLSWDTHVQGPSTNQWTSMFLEPNYQEYVSLSSGASLNTGVLVGNEHQEFAHWALLDMGWQGLYSMSPMKTIDLNESIFRTKLSETEPGLGTGAETEFHYCDTPATPLAERCIPHPAIFAGVPDFSYAIHDWLNKNQFCPALPLNADSWGLCYEASVWIGASLNSSHFGDQAEATYRHFHKIAVSLALNAKALRTHVVAAEAGVIYTDEAMALVREAELQALAYEGYAQHFLQDRWASGHMWNRWNGPSYESINTTGPLFGVQLIGLISGIIHGAEAVLRDVPVVGGKNGPGPMSSPIVNSDETKVSPVTFKDLRDGNLYPMIGDYRLKDMLDRSFGEEYGYSGIPLRVPDQELSMLLCSKAGWADVASNFYDNGDGTFGMHNLPIGSEVARFDAPDLEQATDGFGTTLCWSHWATNEAMATGITHLGQSTLLAALLAAGATGSILFDLEDITDFVPLKGGEFGKMYYRIVAAMLVDPDGTDLAQGLSLGKLNGVQPGNAFLDAIPTAFQEPAGSGATPFEGLPDHTDLDEAGTARPGLDKHTIMGFFNKAHAGHWCEKSEELLSWDDSLPMTDPMQGLRMPVPRVSVTEPADLQAIKNRTDACVYMADRLYSGTKASYMPVGQQDYTGESEEYHTDSHSNGPAATPTCEIINALPTGLDAWEDNPYDLHPGYVRRRLSPSDFDNGPYATTSKYDEDTYKSLLNWCNAVPVVHINSDDVASDPNDGEAILVTPGFDDSGTMSFDPAIIEPTVTIYGYNFGPAEGRLKLESENSCVDELGTVPYADIVAWTDTAISFKVTGNRFPPDLYRITIIRDDANENLSKIRSVGRALLDVRRAAFSDVISPGAPLQELETSRDQRAVHPFCAGGTVLHHEIWDCTAVSPTSIEECGDPLLLAGTKLFDSGPFTAQAGPYDQHEWQVTAVGRCDTLFFPTVACPTLPPANYGLLYRISRLSELSITVTAQLWRFTLAWERVDAP